MTSICTAAQLIFRLTTLQPIDEELLEGAASYFANTESPVAPTLFRYWFTQVHQTIRQQPELLRIGEYWQDRMSGRKEFSIAEAEELHREFFAALQKGKLTSQAIVCGLAERRANGPFDYEISHNNRLAGWGLMYTVAGEACFRCGIRDTQTGPGDALLVSPNALFTLQRSTQCASWSHYWISFQPKTHWRQYLEWQPFGPDAYILSIPREGQSVIRSAFDALNKTSSSKSRYKVELENNLMEHLLLRLAEFSDTDRSAVLDARVQEAQRYISENFDKEFTVREVADHVHMSSSRLTSLFKKQTGLSIFGWRDEKRLTRAAKLLRSGKLSVAEVGRQIGIQDAAYFSRLFRRYVGSSPRAYRQGGKENSS
ncbi:arabinose operon transcriptional regulator AraC [Parahaliea maris]|uniref:Arabinose operon transcriptional regulator AraC n=1 Tax=Parahaliea maris TaxID=2716870 RepID=A0A5C8ZR57_9GAMM|nr:arabinose operon transcriptional regulator AraC [Parahaliea maris]TXS89821.1 arabinose operon transcriptional regulator AraC [Parahaliea maris]